MEMEKEKGAEVEFHPAAVAAALGSRPARDVTLRYGYLYLDTEYLIRQVPSPGKVSFNCFLSISSPCTEYGA
jgi:hypothetical protein